MGDRVQRASNLIATLGLVSSESTSSAPRPIDSKEHTMNKDQTEDRLEDAKGISPKTNRLARLSFPLSKRLICP